MFTRKLVNRLTMPTKHVLICEDDIEQQRNLLGVFQRLFGHQGHVQVSVVPGGAFAAALFWFSSDGGNCGPAFDEFDLVLLDHDMPIGNGTELIASMERNNPYQHLKRMPIITASGIPSNNDALMAAGATYKFTKQQIINGDADDLLRELLKL